MSKKWGRLVALIDYENLKETAKNQRRRVNWQNLRDMILQIGSVFSIDVYLSNSYMIPTELEEIGRLGFRIIVCPKTHREVASEKLEDNVDINIIKDGLLWLDLSEIGGLIVVSDDRHLGHLASEVRKRGKKLHVIASEKVSQGLREAAGHISGAVPTEQE